MWEGSGQEDPTNHGRAAKSYEMHTPHSVVASLCQMAIFLNARKYFFLHTLLLLCTKWILKCIIVYRKMSFLGTFEKNALFFKIW
jgi:hypothetical protein